MKYRWIAVLLLVCMCFGLFPAAYADNSYDDSISVQAIFQACYDFFAGFEGHYDSVSAKDSNALSIGRLQWHASRAHALLKKIVLKNPTKMAGLLSTSLYNEIVNQTDASWNTRCLTASEAAQIKNVISTTEGIDAQDAQAYSDICMYISIAWSAGFRSNATIMYYASVLNQYGTGGAKTWLSSVRTTLGITASDTVDSLNALHAAVLACPNINYKTSRQKVYDYISSKLSWNLDGPDAPMNIAPLPCVTNGHTWKSAVVTAPTCTAGGTTKYTCSVCGETTTTPTAALGHNYGSNGKCTRCGAVKPSSYPSSVFTDVPASAWYREAVDYALTHNIFAGTSATTFSPNEAMNRAMLVTVIYSMAGKPYVNNGGKKIFSDVAVSSYYYTPVLWASIYGLMDGVSETSFAPKQAITREQLVLVMYKFADYNGTVTAPKRTNLNDFADGNSVSAFAKEAMLWAVENGVLAGTVEDGVKYLKPKAGATRAEVAQILMSFCEKIK